MKTRIHTSRPVSSIEILCRGKVDRSIHSLGRVFEIKPSQLLNRGSRVSVLAAFDASCQNGQTNGQHDGC